MNYFDTLSMLPRLASPQLFKSFYQGGFEAATHVTRHHGRLDMIASTQHDRCVETDYSLLRDLGLTTIRDAFRWHLIDRDGVYDFSSALPALDAARRLGVEVIWDLCHFGWPDGVDVFSAEFVERFAAFCTAAARVVANHGDAVLFFVPVNEMSFLSYAAGDEGFFHPFARGRGNEMKRQLVRATIAGIEAIRAVEPRARFVIVDPLVNVLPPSDRPDLAEAAAQAHAAQFEAWDMLAGKRDPELGGNPGYLDIVGANYYHDNQWEFAGRRVTWDGVPADPRRVSFHRMLMDLHARYGRPLLISETGHVGVGRAAWLSEIATEIGLARAARVPVEGVCLYPIIDRHDWENPGWWHHSGLYDLVRLGSEKLERVIEPNMASALRCAQRVGPDGMAEAIAGLAASGAAVSGG